MIDKAPYIEPATCQVRRPIKTYVTELTLAELQDLPEAERFDSQSQFFNYVLRTGILVLKDRQEKEEA